MPIKPPISFSRRSRSSLVLPGTGSLEKYIFNPLTAPPLDNWIFRSFLARNDLAIWIGQRKHRKTNLILQFAFSAAIGKSFLWFDYLPERPIKIVFIDYESKSRPLRQRYLSIAHAMNLNDWERRTLQANLEILEVHKMQKSGTWVPPFPVTGEIHPRQAEAVKFWNDFVLHHPADLYIIDPLRSLHRGDENDSRMEALLSSLRSHFRATVVISHHMRKSDSRFSGPAIERDIKSWADGARGSGALTAHADVIIGQELRMDKEGNERLYFGKFMKDGPDLNGFPLEETDIESFYWRPSEFVPEHLKKSVVILRAQHRIFKSKYDAATTLASNGIYKRTAFRHVNDLVSHQILTPINEHAKQLAIKTPISALPCLLD